MRDVVTNTSPLLYLHRLGRLDLLSAQWTSAWLTTPNWWNTWLPMTTIADGERTEAGPGAAIMVIDERPGLAAEVRGLRYYRVFRDYAIASGLHLSPFADGRDPTFYEADYNDWDGIQFGMCSRLAPARAAYANFTSTTYTVTPWSSVDCGPSPIYPGI